MNDSILCKGSNHVNNKSRPCKYFVTPLKRKEKKNFGKMYDLLSIIPTDLSVWGKKASMFILWVEVMVFNQTSRLRSEHTHKIYRIKLSQKREFTFS